MWPSPLLREDGHVLIHLAPLTDVSHVRTSCEDTVNTVVDANSLTQSVILVVVVRDLDQAPDPPTGGHDDMDTAVPLVEDGADPKIVMANPADGDIAGVVVAVAVVRAAGVDVVITVEADTVAAVVAHAGPIGIAVKYPTLARRVPGALAPGPPAVGEEHAAAIVPAVVPFRCRRRGQGTQGR